MRFLRFYEIVSARQSAMTSQFTALEVMRRNLSNGDMSRLENEIGSGLDARTYVPD